MLQLQVEGYPQCRGYHLRAPGKYQASFEGRDTTILVSWPIGFIANVSQGEFVRWYIIISAISNRNEMSCKVEPPMRSHNRKHAHGKMQPRTFQCHSPAEIHNSPNSSYSSVQKYKGETSTQNLSVMVCLRKSGISLMQLIFCIAFLNFVNPVCAWFMLVLVLVIFNSRCVNNLA